MGEDFLEEEDDLVVVAVRLSLTLSEGDVRVTSTLRLVEGGPGEGGVRIAPTLADDVFEVQVLITFPMEPPPPPPPPLDDEV